NCDAFACSLFTDEVFVMRKLTIPNKRRSLNLPDVHPSVTLPHNHPVRRAVLSGIRFGWSNPELLCTEVGRLITNPVLHITFRLHFMNWPYGSGLHKPITHHIGIKIEFPVEYFHEKLVVPYAVGRRSVPEEFFRDNGFIYQRLIHCKYI